MASASKESVEAVVIGAGVGGLVAARQLVERGHTVAVIESRDRVGGRLLSAPAGPGVALDLGATWFWPNEPRVMSLIAELGVPHHPHHIAGDALYHDQNGGIRLDGNPIDVPSGRFTAGADRLAEELAAQLPDGTLRLSTAATAIAEDAVGGLQVDLSTPGGPGQLQGEHVVLALPPALAIHRIALPATLPDRVRSLAGATPVWMGSIAKVVIRYDRAFWRDRGLAGSAMSHIGPMRELHDMSGPDGDPAALFGFAPLTVPGASAPNENDIRDQLRALFGADAPDPTDITVMDWSTEADTTPPGAARLGAYQLFGHPEYQVPTLEGRLHWASTETSPVAPGHIEGAIAAGERAAAAIDAALTDESALTRGRP
ncbi:MAG: NAD(P)/FAD-dependent oxidoreductase [Actinomycetota bacterium]